MSLVVGHILLIDHFILLHLILCERGGHNLFARLIVVFFRFDARTFALLRDQIGLQLCHASHDTESVAQVKKTNVED